MPKQNIFLGSNPNDPSADTLYDGATKINSNFNEIYSTFGDGSTLTTGEIFAFTAPANGTIKRVDGFLGTVGSTDVTFDVKKNGTGTGLTVTVNNSTNGTSTDRRYGTATASISVAAGDEITVEVTDDGSTGDNLSVSFLVE